MNLRKIVIIILFSIYSFSNSDIKKDIKLIGGEYNQEFEIE